MGAIVGLLLGGGLFIFLFYHQIRLIYYRYFKSFHEPIYDYIEQHGLKLNDIYKPSSEDFVLSPFNKGGFTPFISGGLNWSQKDSVCPEYGLNLV